MLDTNEQWKLRGDCGQKIEWSDEVSITRQIDTDRAIERIKDRTSFLQNCHKQDGGKAYDTMMMYEVAELVDDIIGILEDEEND